MQRNEENESEEFFAKRCQKIINNSCVTICLALGNKLRLFDFLKESPQTSLQIAAASGYRERYVREWLNGMVVSGIVDVNDAGDFYSLKHYKHNVICDENLSSSSAKFLPMLSSVFNEIADCFFKDGPRGVSYNCYPEVHHVIASDSDPMIKANLINSFIPSVQGLINELNRGVTVLDIGCGHGMVSYLLGKQFRQSTFIGIDLSSEAVEFAERRAKEAKLANVFFFQHDASKLPVEWSNKFAYVTSFDSIHDQAFPDKVLSEIFRVLEPCGKFSLSDVHTHSNVAMNKKLVDGSEYIYAVSLFHCMPVSLFFENGAGLGTAWGKELAEKMLKEAGFINVDFSLTGITKDYYHCLSSKPK